MGKVKEAGKEPRVLPNINAITDDLVREAIMILAQKIEAVDTKDLTETLLKFVATSQFKAIFEKMIWDFIKKTFEPETFVYEVAIENDALVVKSKERLILPNDLPNEKNNDVVELGYCYE